MTSEMQKDQAAKDYIAGLITFEELQSILQDTTEVIAQSNNEKLFQKILEEVAAIAIPQQPVVIEKTYEEVLAETQAKISQQHLDPVEDTYNDDDDAEQQEVNLALMNLAAMDVINAIEEAQSALEDACDRANDLKDIINVNRFL